MKHPGAMIRQVISSVFAKSATTKYPHKKAQMPDRFRGKIVFYPDKCIGCRMCMRDCPSNAITITKIADKQFKAEINMGKCIYCAQCVDSCLKKALESTPEFELAQIDPSKLKVEFYGNPPKAAVTLPEKPA